MAEFVTPVSRAFAGHEVWECPPNGSGIIALMLMGIMDGFAPSADPLDPLRLHRHVEAARLVYRDRDAFVADPVHADVPVAQLLSDAYISGLRGLISDDHALETLPAAGSLHKDTVYISRCGCARQLLQLHQLHFPELRFRHCRGGYGRGDA